MSAMTPYTYTVLRYIHDITTGEFVNVGVLLYAPDARYASAKCRSSLGRLGKVFPGVNRKHITSTLKNIQKKIAGIGDNIATQLLLENIKHAKDIAASVLPADDSSLQWSPIGAGMTNNPDETLGHLYERMVMRYEEVSHKDRRDESDIWKHFKRDLESRQLLQYFHPKTISVIDDEIEFEHTWKNGILHCLEPVSFDLTTSDRIKEKAHRWFGKISSLKSTSSTEDFRMYFLLGQPSDPNLQDAYEKAVSMLKRIPGQPLVFNEAQTAILADQLANEVEAHNRVH